MTAAVTVSPVHAALAAHGIVSVLPGRFPVDGEVLVHASRKAPTHGEHIGPFRVQNWDDSGWHPRRLTGDRGLPMHINLAPGAVSCIARIESVPVMWEAENEGVDDPPYVRTYGTAIVYRLNTTDTRAEHDHPLAAEFTPGAWAWVLSDVRRINPPVSEYVSDAARCVCTASNGLQFHWEWCPRRKPQPVRGRSGMWTPDPQLVTACERITV